MDLEPERNRLRYQLCSAGFALTALALGLLCADSALHLLFFLSRDFRILAVAQRPGYSWVVGAPITWGSLAGSYLLWGRWNLASWQRRAGLLVLMNSFDLVTWFLHNGGDLGLWSDVAIRRMLTEHEWFLVNLTRFLGWAELGLFASLAADVLAHLEMPGAVGAGQTARVFVTMGASAQVLFFVMLTDWQKDPLWPLPCRAGRDPLIYLLILGSSFLLTVSSLQVTALSIVACRYGQRLLAEWRQIDRGQGDPQHDLLKPRSEADDVWT
jgi:hypothetical protein